MRAGQSFARQYGLWLNCLEHNIFQEIDGLQAVLINPDPTGSEKLLAILCQNDEQPEVVPLPQLKFSNQTQAAGCSRWTLQECRESMQQFLQYARSGSSCQQIEPLTWSDLLQQARLFPLDESFLYLCRIFCRLAQTKQLSAVGAVGGKKSAENHAAAQLALSAPSCTIRYRIKNDAADEKLVYSLAAYSTAKTAGFSCTTTNPTGGTAAVSVQQKAAPLKFPT